MQAEAEAVKLAVDALLEHQARFIEFQSTPEWMAHCELLAIARHNLAESDEESKDGALAVLADLFGYPIYQESWAGVSKNKDLSNALDLAVGKWWVAKLQTETWWQGDKTPDKRIRVRFDENGVPYALLKV